MFEVGRLVARITLEGAQTFGRDLRQVGHEFGSLDEKGRLASERIGRSLTYLGGAIIALSALAIKKFAEFDKAFSQVRANLDASPADFRKLQQAALDAGAATIYTAKEAAEAEANLARAGLNSANILGGALTGSLALAAAGQIEVSQAAEITASTLNQFNLKGERATHVADLLAAGANKAQGGVSDLSMALKQSGLVAAQAGLSVEETVGTLTAFANAGLIGSDAGTAFRQMLLNLMTPTTMQRDLLKQYNIEAYDAQGNFVGITKLAGSLASAFQHATKEQRDYALGVIFGSDAIRAANVLYNEGSKGIEKWTTAVDDAGAAARITAKLQDTLAGDVEKLGGAFDSALITTGSGANGVLRDMVQNLTSLIEWYGALPAPVQQGVLTVGLLSGAVFLFGGIILTTIPKIIEFRAAVATLNQQVPALRSGLGAAASFLTGPWGVALAVAGLAVISLMEIQRQAEDRAKSYAGTLEEGTNAVTQATRDMAKEALAAGDAWAWLRGGSGQSAYDAAERLGLSLDLVTDAALGNEDAIKKVNDALIVGATEGYDKRNEAAKDAGLSERDYGDAVSTVLGAIGQQNKALEDGTKIQEQKAEADAASADSTADLADVMADGTSTVEEYTQSIDELIQSINEANGVQIDAEEAGIRYADTLRDVAAAALESNAGISTSTAEGSKNRQMLIDLAEAGQKAAQANLDAGGSATDYAAALESSRQTFIDQAILMGAAEQDAIDLADKIYKIPDKKTIEVAVATVEARKSMDQFISDYKNKIIPISAVVRAADRSANGNVYLPNANGGVRYYASGGLENHAPKIFPVGLTRIFNEPETGGEAYIPMGQNKRGNALPVLEQVANTFGYDLVPRRGGSGSASSSSATESREVRISGELSLRDGRAYIEGIIDEKIDGENDARGNGVR